jgi:hypothetical protein
VLLSLTSPHLPPSLSLSKLSHSLGSLDSIRCFFLHSLVFILVHLCFTSFLFVYLLLYLHFLVIYCFIYISLSFIALFTFPSHLSLYLHLLRTCEYICCCDYPPSPPVCFSTAILSGFGGSRKTSNEAVTTMLAHEVLTRKIHRSSCFSTANIE